MAPHPVRDTHANGNYRVVESKSSTMSSLMCCTSTRSQKAMTYKESQKKFLWLDPNRWSGQKTVKKEKVKETSLNTHGQDIESSWANRSRISKFLLVKNAAVVYGGV